MTELLEHVARGFEVVGVFTLVVGLLFAVTLALVTTSRRYAGPAELIRPDRQPAERLPVHPTHSGSSPDRP